MDGITRLDARRVQRVSMLREEPATNAAIARERPPPSRPVSRTDPSIQARLEVLRGPLEVGLVRVQAVRFIKLRPPRNVDRIDALGPVDRERPPGERRVPKGREHRRKNVREARGRSFISYFLASSVIFDGCGPGAFVTLRLEALGAVFRVISGGRGGGAEP